MHRVCMQRYLLSNVSPTCPLCRTEIAGTRVIDMLQGVPEAVLIEAVTTRMRATIQRAAQEMVELRRMQIEFNTSVR